MAMLLSSRRAVSIAGATYAPRMRYSCGAYAGLIRNPRPSTSSYHDVAKVRLTSRIAVLR